MSCGDSLQGGEVMNDGGMNKLTVVYAPIGRLPEVITIDNSLQALQEAVGGYIETVPLVIKDKKAAYVYVVILNEEGRLMGLKPQLVWRGQTLRGNLIVTKSDGEDDFASLNEADTSRILDWVRWSKLKYLFGVLFDMKEMGGEVVGKDC